MPLNDEIPVSCCSISNGVIGSLTCDSESEGLSHVGCVDRFGSYIKSHAVSLGAAGIALAVIQVKFLFNLFLKYKIKKIIFLSLNSLLLYLVHVT